jgi:exopolyphosphatase/guanosine-5'-triphosphate,3'-diphosphate pyrophosphatase
VTGRLAAIDLGTNSTRLLVAEPSRGTAVGFTTLERRMTITRLGQGVDVARELAPEAVDRTLAVLREYRAVMDALGVERTRITATSAARDSANHDEFFARVEEVVGVAPELLSGDEEGRLSFDGATAELDAADGPFVVVDIGGGSTEIAVGTSSCDASLSLDIGCVRMTEQFLRHDPPGADELSACLSVVEAYLEDAQRELPGIAEARTFVGLAGTVTTVAAVEIGLAEYDRDAIHHFRLTHTAAEDVFRTLATEPRARRLHNPGLEPGRADVIVGGCCILVSLFRQFGFEECLVSEADILDGLTRSLLP